MTALKTQNTIAKQFKPPKYFHKHFFLNNSSLFIQWSNAIGEQCPQFLYNVWQWVVANNGDYDLTAPNYIGPQTHKAGRRLQAFALQMIQQGFVHVDINW